MMIDPKAGLSNLATQQSQRSSGKSAENLRPKADSASESESVSLSKEALSLKKLEDTIAQAPVIDQDKVARLKAAIADGSYKIDTERLAEHILTSEGI